MLSPRTYLNENPFWGVVVSESHRKRDVFTSLFYEWFYWDLPAPLPNTHILFFFFEGASLLVLAVLELTM